MGCDIHLHTEVKIGGAWHHYSHPNVNRWYGLFTKMAGVRGVRDVTPISHPKGLPDLPSYLTALDAERWEQDGHSHSWLDAREIAEVHDWVQKVYDEHYDEGNYRYPEQQWGYLFNSGWDAFHKYKNADGSHNDSATSIPPEIQDIRWVFWFDN